MTRGRAEVASLPGFRQWFAERGHWLSEEFRAVLEADMDSGAVGVASHYSDIVEARATPNP